VGAIGFTKAASHVKKSAGDPSPLKGGGARPLERKARDQTMTPGTRENKKFCACRGKGFWKEIQQNEN